jgi:hypothetical protein
MQFNDLTQLVQSIVAGLSWSCRIRVGVSRLDVHATELCDIPISHIFAIISIPRCYVSLYICLVGWLYMGCGI